MTYAKYYKKNNVKEYQILYQVRDGKSITDSPYAIFKSLIQQPRYRKYKHIWVVDHKHCYFIKQDLSTIKM